MPKTEGIFMQSLNIGCLLLLGLVGFIFVLGVIGSWLPKN